MPLAQSRLTIGERNLRTWIIAGAGFYGTGNNFGINRDHDIRSYAI